MVCLLLVQVLAALWALLVVGSSNTLGEVALLSADDAIVLFILAALSLLSTAILALVIWRGSRRGRKLEQELAGYREHGVLQAVAVES